MMNFQELLIVAFTPVNTVLSVLLVLSVVYWLFTIITGLDVDLGVDMDVDSTSGDVPDDVSGWFHFLKFLNLDIVPITYFLTISLFFTWLMSIYAEVSFSFSVLVSALLVIPMLILSVLVTKLLLKPLNPFFREINHKGEKSHEFLGREGRMKSTIYGNKIGILEVFIGSDPMTLMVKSKSGKKIDFGTNVIIVDQDVKKKYYYVDTEIRF